MSLSTLPPCTSSSMPSITPPPPSSTTPTPPSTTPSAVYGVGDVGVSEEVVPVLALEDDEGSVERVGEVGG